jgi:hypothetical protein
MLILLTLRGGSRVAPAKNDRMMQRCEVSSHDHGTPLARSSIHACKKAVNSASVLNPLRSVV